MSITNMREFAAKGRSLVSNATKARDVLQDMLVFAIRQAHEHKNVTPATDLAVKYLPNTGMRRQDALTYLFDHAPVRWDKKADAFKYAEGRLDKVGSIADAEKVAWYEYSRDGDRDPAAFDPLKDLRSTISSLKRKAEKAEQNKSPGLAELYSKMVKEATRELEHITSAIERARNAEAANTADAKKAVTEH